jgi:deoxyribonuclease (pyrimidine dimer)
MTRINCIPPQELTDKHLIAEYRELPRIYKLSRHCDDVPESYKLGTGHIKFFYDKGEYLRKRFEDQIVPEMRARGFKTNFTKYRKHGKGLNNDWKPTGEAMLINRIRIAERLRK